MFVPAMLSKLHQEKSSISSVLGPAIHRKRSRAETVITTMTEGPYNSTADSLGVLTAF